MVPEADRQTRISIFLNIFDVHVNRSPISGVVTDITYKRGKFLVASREDASAENEQNIITVRAEDGTDGGLQANRRPDCAPHRVHEEVGDLVQAGERVGLIKFGSRVDVIFGPEWRVEVSPGSRVSAGSSILARRGRRHRTGPALAAGIEEALSADVSQPAVDGNRRSAQAAAARGLCAADAVYGGEYFSGLFLDHPIDSRRDEFRRESSLAAQISKSRRRRSGWPRRRTGSTAASRG